MHGLGSNQQSLKRAVGKARATEDVRDRQGALRHVRSVLEQTNVAGHQRRRGETKNLPEGKIPWHDRQHNPQRLKVHVAFRGVSFDDLIREMLLCGLGVIATNPGALLGFLRGGLNGLSHLGRHQPRVVILFIFQDLGDAQHHR